MPTDPETTTPRRPFTGEEFLESLRGDREIWIYGERVKNVTTHPAFRNPARMLARLYDALHDPATHDVLTCATDTGSGGYTHKYFRAPTCADDLVGARDAIAAWARLTYGWMGRSPDYKAAFLASLGANAEFFAPYQDNARRWYRFAQERVIFMNHALAHPPVDRHRPPDEVADVYVHVERETDAGLIVSGAKVVATGSALTHYNFIAHPSVVPISRRAVHGRVRPRRLDGAGPDHAGGRQSVSEEIHLSVLRRSRPRRCRPAAGAARVTDDLSSERAPAPGGQRVDAADHQHADARKDESPLTSYRSHPKSRERGSADQNAQSPHEQLFRARELSPP